MTGCPSRRSRPRWIPKGEPFWLQLHPSFSDKGAAKLAIPPAPAQPNSLHNVLVFSCLDGPMLDLYDREVNAVLETFGTDPGIRYIHDADWSTFPEVGAGVLEKTGREECLVAAVLDEQCVWAFGFSMGTKNRKICSKVALLLTLATQRKENALQVVSRSTCLLEMADRLRRARDYPRWTAFQDTWQAFCVSARKKLCCAPFRSRSWIRISSPLAGSATHWAQRSVNYGYETWETHCACCKRPISISFETPPEAKRPKTVHAKHERFAYVVALWGTDPQHVLGAMVLAYSLRRTGTQHDLVCMHTPDVPAPALRLLARSGWILRSVEYVWATARLFTSPGNRFQGVFTKLRAFSLVEYSKVLILDSDLLVRDNIDHIFDLPAPAAMHRGVACGYRHGDKMTGHHFFAGSRPGFDLTTNYWNSDEGWKTNVKGPWSWGQATGINAGVMLFAPDNDTLSLCLSEVQDGMHPEHIQGSGPEQDYLSRFYANQWTHISVAYNFQLHQMYFMLGSCADRDKEDVSADRMDFLTNPNSIKVFHYSADPKPWARWLNPRYACDDDDAWVQEVQSKFGGYRAWVLRDAEYMREGEEETPPIPEWAKEATENLTRSALFQWTEAYRKLADELALEWTELANVVVASCKTELEAEPSSKDNMKWDCTWEELSPAEQMAATTLGWQPESWAQRLWVVPKKDWHELPEEVRDALIVLGETQESWTRWDSQH